MKKIYSSKAEMRTCIVGLILFGLSSVGSIAAGINYLTKTPIDTALVTVAFICGAGHLSFMTVVIFALNSMGCKIWYDKEKGEICREGYFCGFKFRLKVSDIENVIAVTYLRGGKYIVFIDEFHRKSRWLKRTYIQLAYKKEALEFVKEFWDKPIEKKELMYTSVRDIK